MIQRIQTVYLILGALALLGTLLFDSIWRSEPALSTSWFSPLLLVLEGLAAVAAIVAIFLYKDRYRQIRVVVAAQVLTLLAAVVLYGTLFLFGEISLVREGELDMGRLFALVLPMLAYVFLLLARKGIQADIELVKSMDRLR